MNYKKKAFLVFLFLVIGFSFSVYAVTFGDVTYYKSNAQITIIGPSSSDITEVTIPSKIEGLPVTSIDDGAFYNCSSLASISIPDSVTSIGDQAFYKCSSLTYITIPDSVTSIGDQAFYKCSSLTDITIPDSVISIGTYAFSACAAIRYCTINTSGSRALSKAGYSFVDPQYPGLYLRYSYSGDDIVGFAVVDADVSITEVVFPDGITSIGYQAFYNCFSLASISIPDSVTSIGYQAFNKCSSLASVTIPDSVTSIGDTAFSDCSSLSSVTIPDSVTSIGSYAFSGCPATRYCTINTSGSRTLSKAGYSFVDPQYPWLYLRYSYSGDDIVGFAVVDADESISEAVLPDGITSIGGSAFRDCSSLASITIPDSVSSIGSYAFYNCSSLASVTIPDSVTSIGSEAFYSCSSLTSVIIPDSVTSIGSYAFSGCPATRYCTINTSGSRTLSKAGYSFVDPQYPGLYLRYSYSGDDIVGFAVVDADESISEVVIPDGITSIGDSAFSSCSSLASVTIPDSVSSIGSYAFYNCSSLTSVSIPDSVTAIGISAFNGCPATRYCTINTSGSRALSKAGYSFVDPQYPGLYLRYSYSGDDIVGFEVIDADESITEAVLPDGITSIGGSAFRDCSSLASITIPDSVSSIGSYAFYNCSSLASVTIPDSVSSIGSSAFSGCSGLASISIPDSVTSIGSYTFYDCSSLASIIIPDSVTSIDHSAFDNCSSLASVTIPDSVSSIGSYVFYNCSSLSSVTIPDSVTSIGGSAFYNCSSLASVTIPDSVSSIGNYAFQYCSKLKYIYLPSSIQSFPANLFSSKLTVYCHEYSEADYWATGKKYTVIYVDGGNMDTKRTVELSPKSLTMAKGNSFELQTTICPELDMPELIWSSSNPEIISVNSGTLTAHDKGTAVISLTVGSKTATMSAESYLPVESFTLPEEEWVLAKSSLSLAPQEYYPEDALPVFSWTSSDDSVATVDQNGLVTGRKPGDVQITATSETGISESCTVHICYPVTEITFDSDVLSVHMQDEALLVAHVTMRDQQCDNRMVKYTSSDETVATIDESGRVTPHKIGTVTLTATAESGVTASIECSVLPCRVHVPVLTPGALPVDGHAGLSIGSVCSVCGLVLETPQEIESVTSLSLPAALKTINAKAFEKTAADHVLLPAGTTAIGSRAFADAPNLRFVTVPDSVTSIAPDAFEGCELVTFFCSDSSAAAAYAEAHGFAHTAP